MNVFTEVYAEVTAPRQQIHPRHQSGFWRRVRNGLSFYLQTLLFFAPWITWNGNQAVLVDVAGRRLHLFNLTFWPQETYFLLLLLIFMAVTLFAVTAVAGRVWCAYACPQTLLTQAFIMVERFTEGDRAARIRLDKSPWNANKILRRGLKYSIWMCQALWLGVTITGLFTPVRELVPALLTGKAASGDLSLIAFFATASFLDFGFFREQMCWYVCPYGRFQSAMLDPDTMIIGYDANRGEPRGKKGQAQGDCIDCTMCVQVCPMGVDIRKGLLMECIHCTACSDACDAVMHKIGKPGGLVGYTSLNRLQGKPSQVLRPRLALYAVVLSLVGSLAVLLFLRRSPLEVDVVRSAAVFATAPDGRITNGYVVKIINKSLEDRQVELKLAGFPGAELVSPENPVSVPADSLKEVRVVVLHPQQGLAPVNRFSLEAQDLAHPDLLRHRQSSFLGPGL